MVISADSDGNINEESLPSRDMVQQYLDKIYAAAWDGGLGFSSIDQIAKDYTSRHSDAEDAIESLISWQTSHAGMTGFAGGVGGPLTSMVAIPASTVSVIGLQLRMAAAIAVMRGHDPKSNQFQTFVYACLLGNKAAGVLKVAGVNIATRGAQVALKNLSGQVLARINRLVGFRLVTKFGTTGSINLVKFVPVAGGLAAGGIDYYHTRQVGVAAKHFFPSAGSRTDPVKLE